MPTVNQLTTQPGAPSDEDEAAARELADWAERLEDRPPQEVLRWAVERYAEGAHADAHAHPDRSGRACHPGKPGTSASARGLVMACSFGMQSVVMLDMLAKMDLLDRVEVFYLDTGVLFPQTHQTRLRVQERYSFRAVRVAPALSWAAQQEKFGGHLYERGEAGIAQCCHIRKVEPTRRYLADKAAWITGMRRSHAGTRAAVPVVGWDAVNRAVKINPMAAIDDATVWGYIQSNGVPYNPLYDQGYPSIGCNTPVCTRPVKPGDDPRSGRWGGVKAECGIHMDGQAIKSLDSSKL